MSRQKIAALAAVATLALSGCGASQATGPDAQQLDEPSRSENALVSVQVTGDVSFDWERHVPLQIVRLTPEQREGQLLSIGILDFVEAGDDEGHFRFAFDLVGGYDGAGTYEIPVKAPEGGVTTTEGGLETGLMSAAFLIHLELEDPSLDEPFVPENYARVGLYDTPGQPCRVEVGESETDGSLHCPELADAEGNTVALRATWRLTG